MNKFFAIFFNAAGIAEKIRLVELVPQLHRLCQVSEGKRNAIHYKIWATFAQRIKP